MVLTSWTIDDRMIRPINKYSIFHILKINFIIQYKLFINEEQNVLYFVYFLFKIRAVITFVVFFRTKYFSKGNKSFTVRIKLKRFFFFETEKLHTFELLNFFVILEFLHIIRFILKKNEFKSIFYSFYSCPWKIL